MDIIQNCVTEKKYMIILLQNMECKKFVKSWHYLNQYPNSTFNYPFDIIEVIIYLLDIKPFKSKIF